MMMWPGTAIFLSTIFVLPGWAVGQNRYDPSGAATIEAIARGEVREALGALEARALEAEKNATASSSPKQNWTDASHAYREASRAALSSGQLQKAIAYGNKAVDMAERAKNFALQTAAIYQLQQSYSAVGNHAKAREWIDRGLELAKQIQQAPSRRFFEASFLRELGTALLLQGKRDEAIERLSQSLNLFEAHLAFLKSPRARGANVASATALTQQALVYTLFRLGLAYQRAGKAEDGLRTYERGIAFIKETGLKSPTEVSFYWALGDLYLRKKEFANAQANLQKTLEMAERLRLSSIMYQASSQLGDLNLQTQRPAEAIPYYRRAIQTIESTRSLLESEEFRSSYFEDKRATYAGLILAHLRTKNFAEAFNYSERARA